MMRRTCLAIGTLCLSLCSSVWATVTASVDNKQLGAGDTVQLILQSDQRGGDEPDLAPLNKDFDVLGRSTSSSMRIVNGQVSSQRQLILTLSPKHSGQIMVPPLSWHGEQTVPVTLTVSSGGGGNSGPAGTASSSAGVASHVFVTTAIDNPRPYVQAAVTVKVRVYADLPLSEASVDLPGDADVLVEHTGKDIPTQETRNGHDYQVVERTYVLFPQRSGRIELPGPVLDAQVADGSSPIDQLMGGAFGQMQLPVMRTARPVRVHGDPIILSVRARPASMANQDWLPAQQLSLAESWQPDHGPLTAGQPITRHIRVTAIGLSAGQLPDLSASMPLPAGLKAYPDQAKLDNGEQAGRIVGRREQDIALIADRPGHYELPAMNLSWWDTQADQRREVSLPARTLDVVTGPGLQAQAPGGNSAGGATPLTRAGASPTAANMALNTPSGDHAMGAQGPSASPLGKGPWPWVSVVLGALWLGTMGAWAVSHRRHQRERALSFAPTQPARPSARSSASALKKACLQACQVNQAGPARDAILQWAHATWPDQPLLGLNGLARHLGDTGLAPLLRELDRACVTHVPWQGEPLAQALQQLGQGKAAPVKQPEDLPALYSKPGK